MTQFEPIIEVLRDTKTILVACNVSSKYSSNSIDADAIIRLTQLAVDSLVWSVNIIGEQRGVSLNVADFRVTQVVYDKIDLFKQLDKIDIVCGWLNSPFLYDSRKELRDAAVVNLKMAMMLIEGIIEYLAS